MCFGGWAALIWIIEKIVQIWSMCSQHSCWFSPETLYSIYHSTVVRTKHASWETFALYVFQSHRAKYLLKPHHIVQISHRLPLFGIGWTTEGQSISSILGALWGRTLQMWLATVQNLRKSPSRLAYSVLWKPTGALLSFVTKTANAGTLELWLWK